MVLYNWFVNRHSAKIILTYRHLIKHSMSYSSAPWSSDHFLLFLIWTIWDKIIWDTESKLPTIRYHVYLWEKVPRVNFKLPDLLPVYPQEIVVPVEHFVSKFPVVFWKILTGKPDVKAAVKDLQITGDYVTAVQIIENWFDWKVNCFVDIKITSWRNPPLCFLYPRQRDFFLLQQPPENQRAKHSCVPSWPISLNIPHVDENATFTWELSCLALSPKSRCSNRKSTHQR